MSQLPGPLDDAVTHPERVVNAGWGLATPQAPDQSATATVSRRRVGERSTDWEPPRVTEMPTLARKKRSLTAPRTATRDVSKGSR